MAIKDPIISIKWYNRKVGTSSKDKISMLSLIVNYLTKP